MNYKESEARDAELRAIVSPEIMHLAYLLHRLALSPEESAKCERTPCPLYLEQAVAIASRPELRIELSQAIDLVRPTKEFLKDS